MLPLLFVTVSSQRPSPILPFNDSPPTDPDVPTGISVLILPKEVLAETV
jgi:hypothetical protein